MSSTSGGGSGGGGDGAFSAGMAGMQFGAQLGAAYSAYNMQKLQNEFSRESALAAIQLDSDILIRRTNEEARAYSQANLDLQRRSMEAEASANVAFAESGIGGVTVERLQNNIKRQEAQISSRQNQSFESRMDNINDQFTRASQTMVARMQGLTPPTQPNLLAMAAQSFGPMLANTNAASDFDEWWGSKFDG